MPEEIELQQIIELVEGPSEEFQDFLSQSDLSEDQLKKLLEAERAAKNREAIVKRLKDQLGYGEEHEEPKEVEIGKLKAVRYDDGEDPHLVIDIDGVQLKLSHNPLLEFGGHSFEVAHPHDDTDHFHGVRKVDGFERAIGGNRGGFSYQQKGNSQAPVNSPPQREKRGTATEETVEKKDGRKEKLREELEQEYGVDPGELEDKTVSELEDLKEKLDREEELRNKLKSHFGVDQEKLEDKDLDELESMLEDYRRINNKREELAKKYDINEEKVEDKNLEELKDLEEKLERTEEKREELKEEYGIDDSRVEGKDLSELNELEDELEKKRDLMQELAQYGYSREELEGKSIEEIHDLIDEVKQKKRIISDIGAEFEDERLSQIPMEDLQKLKEEKEEREALISELKDEGVDQEKLDECSNEDLRKLKENLENSEIKEYEQILEGTVEEVKESLREMDDPDYQKLLELEEKGDNREELKNFLKEYLEADEDEKKEIEEKAEEDIEMLKGAVAEEEEEEDEEELGEKGMEKLDNIKKQFQNSWRKLAKNEDEEDEEDSRFSEEEMFNVLEKYREENKRESAIKTAQVMKAYLEYKMGIPRELTYGELAENLSNLEEKDEDIERMQEFFEYMQAQEYSGKIAAINMSEVLDAAENTVRKLG